MLCLNVTHQHSLSREDAAVFAVFPIAVERAMDFPEKEITSLAKQWYGIAWLLTWIVDFSLLFWFVRLDAIRWHPTLGVSLGIGVYLRWFVFCGRRRQYSSGNRTVSG